MVAQKRYTQRQRLRILYAVVAALGVASLQKVKRLSVIEVELVIQQVFQKFKK